MPVKITLFTLTCFLIYSQGIAQNDDDYPLKETFLSVGSNGQKSPLGTLENFRKMAPGSPMLMNNLNSHYLINYKSDGSLYLFGFGYKRTSNKTGPTIRFALGFSSGIIMEGEHKKVSYFRIDTLTSSNTGEKIYIDSAVFENYKFNHHADFLTLDISLIWRSFNKHKMKLFCGIGTSYGTSGNEATTLTYHNYNIINYYPRFKYTDNVNTSETYIPKTQVFVSLYCPFGLDYQLSKKSNFWKNLHLFLESRAQLYYKKIPEIGKFVQGRMQIGFGVRVTYE